MGALELVDGTWLLKVLLDRWEVLMELDDVTSTLERVTLRDVAEIRKLETDVLGSVLDERLDNELAPGSLNNPLRGVEEVP